MLNLSLNGILDDGSPQLLQGPQQPFDLRPLRSIGWKTREEVARSGVDGLIASLAEKNRASTR